MAGWVAVPPQNCLLKGLRLQEEELLPHCYGLTRADYLAVGDTLGSFLGGGKGTNGTCTPGSFRSCNVCVYVCVFMHVRSEINVGCLLQSVCTSVFGDRAFH